MKLRWVPEAAEDLRDIHDFLHVNSPRLAHRIVNQIYAAILALQKTPHIGRPNRPLNTRELILSRIRYKVTYRVRAEAIEILYIRHTSRGPRIN